MTENDMGDGQHGAVSGQRAVPDHGFFAGTPTHGAASPQFGAAAPQLGGAAPQLGGAAPQLGAPPASRFGGAPGPPELSPAQSFAPAGLPLGAPAAYRAPASRSGLPTWAIVVICAVGGLFVLGVVAAVALPAFLAQREKAAAAATVVAVPASIGGLSQAGATAAQRQEFQTWMSSFSRAMSAPQGAVFGDGTPDHSLVVLAGRFGRVLHSRDRDAFVQGFWNSASHGSAGALGTPRDVSPGHLGGRLSCAEMTGTGTGPSGRGQMCVAIDAGALVVSIETQTGHTPSPEFARTVREAVVHR
ncbi:MAG: hypothetical protein ACXV2J_07045 [Actinomycetes bacterium]